jgi:hypothetical protein
MSDIHSQHNIMVHEGMILVLDYRDLCIDRYLREQHCFPGVPSNLDSVNLLNFCKSLVPARREVGGIGVVWFGEFG